MAGDLAQGRQLHLGESIAHVTSFGNGSFGNKTQAQSLQTQEICADCHSSGGFKGVDIVHGQK
jgi:hypothetical protein